MNCKDCKHWKRAELSTGKAFGFCSKEEIEVVQEMKRVAIVKVALTAENSGCDEFEQTGTPEQPKEKKPRSLPWHMREDEREAVLFAASGATADRRR